MNGTLFSFFETMNPERSSSATAAVTIVAHLAREDVIGA
jgi:hypothetical protein